RFSRDWSSDVCSSDLAARLLGIHRITVARKLKFLANQARLSQKKYLEQLRAHPVKKLQFDDMETFEHTKLKPLSITLAVTMERRSEERRVGKEWRAGR